ncbi:MAG: type II toxin-antitoxin system VapC family toxin [Candidatus Aenigmarchaeota archaeon]|nr:type II toxin-antitoxin system VapC family toxin [Candidatus Aenigmarchaeota archaeon]
MIFIDANIFLAYDNINDVHHQRALKLWQKIEDGKYGEYFTSDYVLNEIIGVTLRKLGKERAVILGTHIFNSMLVLNIDDHILRKSFRMFSQTELSLSLVDCTNLAVLDMVGAGMLATFDKEFEKTEVDVVS